LSGRLREGGSPEKANHWFHRPNHDPGGVPTVYAAESISLAALEVLVHLDKSGIPPDYVALGIEMLAAKKSGRCR
jgi:hypothetical protein